MDPQSSYYSPKANEQMTLRERCREFYVASDFVMVMNIDSEPFSYRIQRPENVIVNQPNPVTQEVYYLKDPELIVMQPGQIRLCPGYEADAMIDDLAKKMIHRGRQIKIDEMTKTGQTIEIRESVLDPATQRNYISRIFQGKQDFMRDYNSAAPMQPSLESELGLTNAPNPQTA